MNPFVAKTKTRKRKDQASVVIFAVATYFLVACAVGIFFKIASAGAPILFASEDSFINWDFLTKNPETLVVFEIEEGEKIRMDQTDFTEWKKENPGVEVLNEKTHAYTGGGILGPLVGTAMLVVTCMVVALVVGVSASVYLNEYARKGLLMNASRLAIMNLAGVPSVVFGLFGFALFCLSDWWPALTYTINEERTMGYFAIPLTDGYLSFQGWGSGSSLFAGGLTLAVMVLPVIIAACEESLKAVPKGFREASLALGASKWQCIRTAVLPYATPGILTASILGVTRVAGETAPIMFTAAVADKAKLPWEEAEGNGLFWLSDVMMQSVQALPYHIYTFARLPNTEETAATQNGTVFVFLMLVSVFAGLSIFLRIFFRNKLKW